MKRIEYLTTKYLKSNCDNVGIFDRSEYAEAYEAGFRAAMAVAKDIATGQSEAWYSHSVDAGRACSNTAYHIENMADAEVGE